MTETHLKFDVMILVFVLGIGYLFLKVILEKKLIDFIYMLFIIGSFIKFLLLKREV